MTRVKFISAREVADMIPDRASVCVNGFLMTNAAEELFRAVEDRFLDSGHPKDLKLMFTGSVGDGSERGINHFAHEGLIRECFGAHYGVMRKLSPLILENKIKAYNLPQGITVQLYRAQGAGQPGIISHVGLGTFADPDLDGGKLNEISDEEFVKKVEVDGRPYLYYKTPGKIDYALVRGTEADEDGNISLRKEALRMDTVPVALATKNTGGKVIVQVERIVRRGTIDPKAVALPRNLVDYVCVVQDMKNHMHTQVTPFCEDFISSAGYYVKSPTVLPLNAKKVAARRAAMALDKKDYVLNFGVGVSDMVSMILDEEGIAKHFIQTAESGITGGISQSGGDFGVSRYPEALMDVAYQFDYYQGGGLDAAFLGLAQCDREGNINVSKFGNSLVTGSGGFGDIAQNAKKVVFCGTFMVKSGEMEIKDGKLHIIKEGTGVKFLNSVEQITYSGQYARKVGQTAYAVTERAVFRLEEDGWELLEIAPGVDLNQDVLAHMEFKPMVSPDLKLMDARLFEDVPMGLTMDD